MFLKFIFSILFILSLHILNAQSETIRLTEIKTTWTERGVGKVLSINYDYKFQIGDGPVKRVGKNASNLEKYITDRRAKSRLNKCIKQTKIANTGANLSYLGAGLVVLGTILEVRNRDTANGEKYRFFNPIATSGWVVALAGLNMRSILQKKARESLKESVSLQNNSNSTGSLKFDLDHMNIAWNPDTKIAQISLRWQF